MREGHEEEISSLRKQAMCVMCADPCSSARERQRKKTWKQEWASSCELYESVLCLNKEGAAK